VNVEFRASFVKDLRHKDKGLLSRIKQTIELVEKAQGTQDIAGLKKLKGGNNYYRIRVGDYRLGLIIEGDTATFVRCLNRKEIYRFFP
jgi:mRNA interferase RelE/StbE